MKDIRSIKTKMMMMTTNKIAFIYLFVDIALILVSLVFGGYWLINTQIAFICSMLIVFASFYSYKGMIEKRLEEGDSGDDRDLLDTIDDKHELFEQEQASDLTAQEFKEIYKTERKKIGGLKKSFSNLFKSWSGALGILRLFAYFILFIAIMVMIRKEVFEAIPFLIGLGIIPLCSMLLGFFIRD